MITIDVGCLLDEKRTKELTCSINEMIGTINKLFQNKINNSNEHFGEYQFKIVFDNHDVFYMITRFSTERILFDE